MKEKVYLIGISLFLTAFWGCQEQDMTESNNGSVTVDLAFSVSHVTRETRLTDEVVQEVGSNPRYRGLEILGMIPFSISSSSRDFITSEDKEFRLLNNANRSDYEENKATNYGGFYLFQSYSMMRGTNAFLVYGKAPDATPPSGVSSKVYNGSLAAPNSMDLIYPDLTTLRFRPDPIYNGTSIPGEAQLLADYLTYIANATGNGISWSNTTDPTLKSFFLNFTGMENTGNMVMAGSTVNVIAHVNALYANIVKLISDGGLRDNIIERITNPQGTVPSLISTGTGNDWKLTGIKKNNVEVDYPTSIGLPDGAAALRWAVKDNAYQFVPQTETTTLASINNLPRFCYPPQLFYYANSRINTSDEDINTSYYSNLTKWEGEDGLLAQCYKNENGQVTGNTKAVAIKQPLQYAVGRLKMSMIATTSDLKDGANKPVTWNATSFPLTGIIVCNQHPVDFNFKPLLTAGAASHADDCFIYDTQVGTNCYLKTTEVVIPSTLVLQSYDTGEGTNKDEAEEVTIVMEFRNDSGQKFKGKDGIIYEGTKFYLIGRINPEEANSSNPIPENAQGRVFTRDYVTTINTQVASLANAYNVLPDLLGGRIELGVELTTKWIQAETTNVILQ